VFLGSIESQKSNCYNLIWLVVVVSWSFKEGIFLWFPLCPFALVGLSVRDFWCPVTWFCLPLACIDCFNVLLLEKLLSGHKDLDLLFGHTYIKRKK